MKFSHRCLREEKTFSLLQSSPPILHAREYWFKATINYKEAVRNSVTLPVNFLVLIPVLLMIPKFSTPGESNGSCILTCCPPSFRRFTGTTS